MSAQQKKKRKRKGLLYLVASFFLRIFFYPIYRISLQGRENIPMEGPVLICSNHVAIKDPLLLGIFLKRQVFFMAKAELYRNPVLGGLLRCLGAFPVERGTGGADALAEACRILEDGAMVGVFIEGHRSKDGELQKPKTGAALLAYRTKAPVVPACIAAQDGWRSHPFQRTIIRFGKPITAEELNIPEDSSMHLRRASRTIMARIAELREEAFRELGVPVKEPEES